MKTWKIGLYLICLILIGIWFLLPSTEGFQLTTFNVKYPSKELFLVAPNVRNPVNIYQDGYDTTTTPDMNALYTGAYTKADAKAKCESLGAQLATLGQLQIATRLGADWCLAGWVADDTDMYAPIQPICPPLNTSTGSYPECRSICPNTVQNTTGINSNSSGSGRVKPPALRKFTTPPQRAYPICWGMKPSAPAVDVQYFSKINYSMIGSQLMNLVMNGASTELFPATFTADQASYALEQTNYDGPSARQYLIDNIGSVNDRIYSTDPNYAEDGSSQGLGACTILSNTRTKFQDQFEDLRAIFRDVSGAVISMLGAKNENASFAAKLQNICSKETPESSPACAKLGTLDYDLLYSTKGSGVNLLNLTDTSEGSSNKWTVLDTSTSRLAALEALNTFKFQREGELCRAYDRIYSLETYIGCESGSGSGPIAECTYKDLGSDTGSAQVMKDLDVNSEEFLKMRLKEIAPYFTSPNYRELAAAIINQLSLTIRLPSLNDFDSSNQNWKSVRDRIDSIQSYFRVANS